MGRRFVSIWFPHLVTDWVVLRRPALKDLPFVLAAPDHGKMMVAAASPMAQLSGIGEGMALADARALSPSLEVLDDKPGLSDRLLKALALWFIRYSPLTAVDPPDGLILDATGCPHLWGGETAYVQDIVKRMELNGYKVRVAMADTIGSAWGVARYHRGTKVAGPGSQEVSLASHVVEPGRQVETLQSLSPAALRVDAVVQEKLFKLGLYKIEPLLSMPRAALRRRMGQVLLDRLDQAVGRVQEFIEPVQPVVEWEERLPCLEPISTRTGIEIGLTRVLEALCLRLERAGKGVRRVIFQAYRIDGRIESIEIGTNRATHHVAHLSKLLSEKLDIMEPGPGIELFVLQAPHVEECLPQWGRLWTGSCSLEDTSLSELLDRLSMKLAPGSIHRYLPAEHYWPERSFKEALSLGEKADTSWQRSQMRPLHWLTVPERIEVSAPVPDYPPMLFRYKGRLHRVRKADGPERIEREWWLEKGLHRDYYIVEDEEGCRYWLFRSGHYGDDQDCRWFIHGFFA